MDTSLSPFYEVRAGWVTDVPFLQGETHDEYTATTGNGTDLAFRALNNLSAVVPAVDWVRYLGISLRP